MPLDMAQRYVSDSKQRGATLPAIAKGLRARWKREQTRLREQAAAAAPPDWLDEAIWPTLPDTLRLALQDSTIDDEGYLCYDSRHEAAIVIHENDDPNLCTDLLDALNKLIPEGVWRHDRVDGNGAAHLKAAMLGPGETIPVRGGRLQLGTWQAIMLVDLDGPRQRRVIVTVLADD